MKKRMILSGKTLTAFNTAVSDKVFHLAVATIKAKAAVLKSAKVNRLVTARYASAEFPLCNLYDREGFATPPFRTVDWLSAE